MSGIWLPVSCTHTSSSQLKCALECPSHSPGRPPVRAPCRASPCYPQWPTSRGCGAAGAAPAAGTLPSSSRTSLPPGPGSGSPGRSCRARRARPGPGGRATAAAGSTTASGVWSWCWTGRRGASKGRRTAGKRWADREAGSTGAGSPSWPSEWGWETGCRGAGWPRAGEAAGGSHCCCRRAFPGGGERQRGELWEDDMRPPEGNQVSAEGTCYIKFIFNQGFILLFLFSVGNKWTACLVILN